MQGCLAAGDEEREVLDALARVRAANQEALRDRLQRGVEDGDLPQGTDVAALAQYLSTVSQGISVQASAGASREEPVQVAELALAAVPH